ncbi:hypothetical protein DH09_07090 [Bacillaceae bacterium JMAK1]|nr:hypothetical protein DH09_07090 [Bacillaceae bacterium JMAK1]
MVSLSLLLLLLFVWTIVNGVFMPRLTYAPNKKTESFVSVLVPMRNEERNVPTLLSSLYEAMPANSELIILDDQSTDNTRSLLQSGLQRFSNATVIDGAPLPDGWIGKVHACHQLAQRANGDYLLFLDADVTIRPRTIEAGIQLLHKKRAGLISGFPTFIKKGILGHLLIPLQHFLVGFHLPLYLANHSSMIQASAAHGSFMMFTKTAYDEAGGHERVKGEIVDDVALMRAVKRSGNHAILANITDYVDCYMYETNREVWDGFTKNVFTGIGRSYVLAIVLTLFYTVTFVVPFVVAIYGVMMLNGWLLIPYGLVVLIRLVIDLRVKETPLLSLLHPIAILCLLALLLRSMYVNTRSKGYTWKGRTYQ